METEILERKENVLLKRIEVKFRTIHPNEGTPTRDEIRDQLSGVLKTKKDRIIIEEMESVFGKPETFGYAKVYKTKEEALRTEAEHILQRNRMIKAEKVKEEEE